MISTSERDERSHGAYEEDLDDYEQRGMRNHSFPRRVGEIDIDDNKASRQ